MDIQLERLRQDEQWGGPTVDDTRDWFDWRAYSYKQLTLLSFEHDDQARRERFVKVAALALAAIESIDRKCLTN